MIKKEIICKPVTYSSGKDEAKLKSKIKNAFQDSKITIFKEEEIILEISIWLHSRRVKDEKGWKERNDLDNFIKPIVDVLKGKIFEKESQIKSLLIRRELVSRQDEEKLCLKIRV